MINKSFLWKTLTIFAALFVSGQAVFAQNIGMVEQVSGTVWLMEKEYVWRLKQGDEVGAEHTIITEKNGLARVQLGKKATLNIGPRSRIKLQQYAEEKRESLNFDMLWGKVRYFVKTIVNPNSKFTVKTVTAAIGVRGTEFEVSLPQPVNIEGVRLAPSANLSNIGLQTTTVDMEEGLVVLTDLKGVEHELPAGTITTADANAKVIQTVKGAPIEVIAEREEPAEVEVVKEPEPALDVQKVSSKAAVTTSINTSPLQSSTITPPRNTGFGGR